MNKSQSKQSTGDIKARLRRAQSQLGVTNRDSTSPSASPKVAVSKKAEKLRQALGGEIISSPAGEYIYLKQFYDQDYIHGQVKFRSLTDTTYRLSHFSAAAEDTVVTPDSFLFFDTETTGLSGAGAVPFLIGFGSFVAGGFETQQYIIPDFADEAAMLEDIFAKYFAESAARKTLVSYNGKAFDKPLIEDRLIIHRIARKILFQHHIDLLHTARSLFKRRLGDCSLGNIERHALGYERGKDIPGYLVPAVYLDWIHQDETAQLADVISHNRQDIVSLAALIAVISESFISAGSTLTSTLDAYSLMRLCEKRRRSGLQTLAVTISREREEEFRKLGDPEVEFQRAMVFKRAGDFESAVKIWRRLEACGKPDQVFLHQELLRPSQAARLELAKWYEHRCKDFHLALSLAKSGSRSSVNRSTSPIDKIANWDQRCLRLQRRIASNSSPK